MNSHNLRWGRLAAALAAAVALTASGSEVQVHGGTLKLGGTLSAARLALDTGATLSGDGTLKGNLDCGGLITPTLSEPGFGATFTVQGSIRFLPGSFYVCHVIFHASSDRISATSTVRGDCRVVALALPGAIPVDRQIIVGSSASDYSGFVPDDPWNWKLGQTGALNLTLTSLRGDSDSDGLPDWWELAYFSSRTAGLPLANNDGDGANNLGEYAANTNPTNAASYLRLTKAGKTPANRDALQWTTSDGRLYRVMSRTNLMSGTVSTAAVIGAYSQPIHSWTNAPSAASRLYYFIDVQETPP